MGGLTPSLTFATITVRKGYTMSIEMENPETLLEKTDAVWNLLHQLRLAHVTQDDGHFTSVFRRADELLEEIVDELGEQ